jgi:predicted permease
VRSFGKLAAVDPGFEPDRLLTGLVQLSGEKYGTPEQQRAAFDRLLEKLRAIPGVERATVGSDLPINTNWQTGVSFEHLPPFPPGQTPLLNAAVVDPEYFETLRIPLIAGRPFEPIDGPGQPLVTLVSESIARKYFRDRTAVGGRLKQGLPSDSTPWLTIVGVVKDTRTEGPGEDPRGTFYLPRGQTAEELHRGWVVIRSDMPEGPLTTAVRRALAEVDRDVPLALPRTMDDALAEQLAAPRFAMLMLGIFAVVALLLAAVGIYGVIAHNVTQRTGEIGVRRALGAPASGVVGLVLRQALLMAGAGVAIGVGLALLGGRSISALLYGVGPRDPVVLVGVSVFLMLVAVAAAIAPAIRAARIDPALAMRGE